MKNKGEVVSGERQKTTIRSSTTSAPPVSYKPEKVLTTDIPRWPCGCPKFLHNQPPFMTPIQKESETTDKVAKLVDAEVEPPVQPPTNLPSIYGDETNAQVVDKEEDKPLETLKFADSSRGIDIETAEKSLTKPKKITRNTE